MAKKIRNVLVSVAAMCCCAGTPPPEGAIDLKGKGIGAELQFIPGAWGRNLPIDADLSAIEIR